MNRKELLDDLEETLDKIEVKLKSAGRKVERGADDMAEKASKSLSEMRASTKKFAKVTAPDAAEKAWNEIKEKWTRVEKAWDVLLHGDADRELTSRARETMAGLDEMQKGSSADGD